VASPFNMGDDESLSRNFWEGIAEGEFRIQKCQSCGSCRFPPTNFCPDCHGIEFAWLATSGQATLWTYTVVHRAPTPDLAAFVPYTLVVGQLREGPLVMARLVQSEPGQVAIGLPIAIGFHTDAGGAARYHFLPNAGHMSKPPLTASTEPVM
jgi:uncharacterized OB-fold protein